MRVKNAVGGADNLGMARARLGMAFQDVRGAMGSEVVIGTRAGLAVRGKQRYKYPVQPSVRACAGRMVQANAAWNELTLAQVEAWRVYADGLSRVDPVTLQRYSPTAKNAFVGLATKFLQINPSGTIPVWPPSDDFVADSLRVSVTAASGGVLFAASGDNTSGTLTELLVQPLKNIRRLPGRDYKSLAFHAFDGSALFVGLEPGAYAFAFRFVRASTGQATMLMPIGVAEV